MVRWTCLMLPTQVCTACQQRCVLPSTLYTHSAHIPPLAYTHPVWVRVGVQLRILHIYGLRSSSAEGRGRCSTADACSLLTLPILLSALPTTLPALRILLPAPPTTTNAAEWRWHRNQDDGPESADSVSVVRDPDCKSLRAARVEAWRQRLATDVAQQQAAAAQEQQQRREAAVEEEAEEQALLLEQEALRREATARQRAQLHAQEAAAEQQQQQQEGQQQHHPCLWHRLCQWVQRAAQQLGWLQ